MKLKRFLPMLAVCLLATFTGVAIHQTQPAALPEPPPFSWREFEAQLARDDAAIAAAFRENDEPERQEKHGAKNDFSAPQTTVEKLTTKRSETMPDLIVTLAGSTDYRGTYVQIADVGGLPAWQLDGSHFIYWSSGGTRYLMHTSTSGAFFNAPYVGPIGTSGGDPTSATITWTTGTGTAPAPNVAYAASDAIAPTFASASAATNGNSVAVVLTEADSAPVLPSTGVTGFTVLVNGVSRTISSATAASTTVTLNLASPVYVSETVTVSYAPGNVEDSADNAMTSFGAQSVTNNSTVKATRRPVAMVNGKFSEIKNSEQLPPAILPPDVLVVALSDETTAITTGTNKVIFRMPFALTLSSVRASLSTASSSGNPTFDINKNGTTILSTKLTVDASEKTSTTAATAAVISTAALGDDDEISLDCDVSGTGAKGAKVYLTGVRA